MYRRLLPLIPQGRNPGVCFQNVSFLIPKNNETFTLPISRTAIPRRHRALSTSAAVSSEIKDGPEPPKEEKRDEERETEPKKSGKESLLDLLGAMKVEVTSKKKFQALKLQKSKAPASRPAPVVMESTISMFQKATEGSPPQSEGLNPELVAAASAAASSMPNSSQAESELLQQLRRHETISEAQKKGDGRSIGSIIADMKVGRQPNARQNAKPANQIRFDEDGQGFIHDRSVTSELDGVRRRKGLFLGKRLNIFSPVSETDEPDTVTGFSLTLWDLEMANQIAQATRHLPRNGFEEMIQWTKEGKLWQYPINNEGGLEEEASVPFHEHVFLEKHLEEGFPRQGPVRHFMELVVAGLVKNPHLTVRQKEEHIAWFREYFQQKEDVLREAEVYLN
ncbi:28S ribosomal protein S31, mitochondrial [Megalops cyprinoides]|uniref:28S ribosomal protein S31, mitochondrial n=1 Tax=Megalops cyprinoides TaxID=118141 RepID=UPI001863CA12|nr:28S ribosomal protein S31, mitochondrial [Megalops cyprinoides]